MPKTTSTTENTKKSAKRTKKSETKKSAEKGAKTSAAKVEKTGKVVTEVAEAAVETAETKKTESAEQPIFAKKTKKAKNSAKNSEKLAKNVAENTKKPAKSVVKGAEKVEKSVKNTTKSLENAAETGTEAAEVDAEDPAAKLAAAKKLAKESKKAAKMAKKAAKVEKRQQKSRRGLALAAVTLAALALILSGGTTGFLLYEHFHNKNSDLTIHYNGKDGNSTNFTDNSVAAVANSVAPAVVSILTETRYLSWTGQTTSAASAGTGMIVSSDGYVLTNKHVIEDANSISVQTDDGETYTEVKVVGTDPLNDVAFLKIPDVEGLPTVTLGNSKTIVHGQPVVAIGNALGQFQNSVTEGIVSGTGRTITASDSSGEAYETLHDLIQTDAAINPGNSGGPLVNAAGEVIGINTAVSTSANGISFAIPISSVKGMLKGVVEKNTAERAYIGAYYTTITPSVAKSYDLPVKSGAYIHVSNDQDPIIKGSPADKAGLMDGDIIVAVNGETLGNYSLSSMIGEYMPGETIELTVIRSTGKEKVLEVVLAAYPSGSDA